MILNNQFFKENIFSDFFLFENIDIFQYELMTNMVPDKKNSKCWDYFWNLGGFQISNTYFLKNTISFKFEY